METKKVKLSAMEWWSCFCGKNHVVNHHTKEVHRLNNKHVNCLHIARKNREYVTHTKAVMLIETKEYNGCRWCWKSRDLG
jgi:hypothetical protein